MAGPSTRRRLLRRAAGALSLAGLTSLSGCAGNTYNGGGMYTSAGFRIGNYDDERRLSRDELLAYVGDAAGRFGAHAPWSPDTRSPFPSTATFEWALRKPQVVTNQFVDSEHLAVVFGDADVPGRYYLYLWSVGRPTADRDAFGDRPNLRLLQHFVAYDPERGTMTDWGPRPPVTSTPVSVSLGGDDLTFPLESGRIGTVDNISYGDVPDDQTHRAEWNGSLEGTQSLHSLAAFEGIGGPFQPVIELMYGGSRRGGALLG